MFYDLDDEIDELDETISDGGRATENVHQRNRSSHLTASLGELLEGEYDY